MSSTESIHTANGVCQVSSTTSLYTCIDSLLCYCRLAQESGNTVCVCGSSHTAPAADEATLTVSRNSTSILVQQSGSQYTESTFEELIHSIFFTYDPTSPQADLQSYRAMIKVTVSDGDFTNQPPAFTTVLVNVMNEAPRVLLDGQVRKYL